MRGSEREGSNRMLSSRPFYFVCLRDLVTDDLLIAQSDVIGFRISSPQPFYYVLNSDVIIW